MQNIKLYQEKYNNNPNYNYIDNGIYETVSNNEKLYVVSLSFEQEKELGEGENAANISQYPLEDILDNYRCYVSDFYKELNTEKSKTCYIEFASPYEQSMNAVVSLVGKHVYNKNEDGTIYLMANDEMILPLAGIPKIERVRKKVTKNQKTSNVLVIISFIFMILFLVFAIVAGFTKNATFMILSGISILIIAISMILIKILNKK